MLATRGEEVSKPCVELAIDVFGREFGEQSRMPECIKSTGCVQTVGPSHV